MDFNTNEFRTLEQVPIFHENDEYGDKFDVTKLEKVVDVNNKRFAKGEYSTLIVGHTTDTEDEKPVIGYIDNLSMGLRNGLNTIFARFRVYAEQANTLKSFPRRSIEISSKSLQMPAVSLLGGSQAALDLGMVYKNQDQQLLKFSKSKIEVASLNIYTDQTPVGDKMPVSDELKEAILEVLGTIPEIAYLQERMKKEAVEAEKNENEEVATEEAAEEEVKDEVPTEDAPEESKEEASSDEPKEEVAAEEVPSEEEDKKEEDDEEKKFAKEQELLTFRKQSRVEHLQSLAKKYGCVFNIEEDVEQTLDFNDEQFAKFSARLANASVKAPVGKKIDTAKLNTSSDLSQREIEEVKAYAIKHCKGDFRAALLTFKKQ